MADELGLIRKHSVLVSGHRTSISLEEVFWRELKSISDRRGVSLGQLVSEVDRDRSGNLSSALRVYVLADLKLIGKKD